MPAMPLDNDTPVSMGAKDYGSVGLTISATARWLKDAAGRADLSLILKDTTLEQDTAAGPPHPLLCTRERRVRAVMTPGKPIWVMSGSPSLPGSDKGDCSRHAIRMVMRPAGENDARATPQ
jgi:hypothetical protein